MLHIESVEELMSFLGLGKPKNPMVSIINISSLNIKHSLFHEKLVLDLYTITLKDQKSSVFLRRKNCDFKNGNLAFTAPNQVLSIDQIKESDLENKLMLVFHPDLIRSTGLDNKVEAYKFFSYDVCEALCISVDEQQKVLDCIRLIKEEIKKTQDYHSKTIFVSILDLLLNYCVRFYQRQFDAKPIKNNYIVTHVNTILKDYYDCGLFPKEGIPNVEYLASKINLSPNYLSDLLKKETGKSAKEYINYFVIDKAKTLLLKDKVSVSKLAYELGFNYPHYFSRVFKAKTGMTPQEYRQFH